MSITRRSLLLSAVSTRLSTASTDLVPSWVTLLQSGQNFVHSLVLAYDCLWCLTNTNPANLIKVDPATGTILAVAILPGGNGFSLCAINNYLYIPLGADRLTILEVSQDCSYVVWHEDTDVAFGSGAITGNDAWLFVVCSSGSVCRYSFVDKSRTICPVSTWGHCMALSESLFIGHLSHARVDRINPVSMTLEQSSTITPGTGITDDAATDATYLWCGIEGGGGSGNVVRISKANLTSQTTIDTGISRRCYGVFNYLGYRWALYSSYTKSGKLLDGGQVVRIDPVPLGLSLLNFPWLQNPNEMVCDGVNAFFSFYNSPSILCSIPVSQLVV